MRPGDRLAAILLAAAAAAGCAASGVTDARPVRAVLNADPLSLSLIGGTDLNSQLLGRLVGGGLVEYDAALRFRPALASAWEISADGKEIVFHLRPGATFHDGVPVTARDVVFTWRAVRAPSSQARSWYAEFDAVESVAAVDDRTVRVRYREPSADALDAWRVPILPEHLAGKEPDLFESAFARSPVGAGPFRFVSWNRGRDIVLETRRDTGSAAPVVPGIRFKIFADERTAYAAMLQGDVDVMGVSPDVWRDALSDAAAVRLARFIYYRLAVWTVDWNQDGSNPFFSDPRIRRAMILALDRERFASAVLSGLARPAAGTWLPESGWAEPALRPWPYDPAEARRLLDEAGWRLLPGSPVRVKNGVPLEFTLLYPAGTQEIADRIAAWIQHSAGEVGASVRLEKSEWKAFQQRRREHRFQAAMATRSLSPTPDQFDLYHSSQRDAGVNYGGFSDPACDADLEAGRRTLDPDARREIYRRVARRIHELEGVSPLFQFAQPVLHDRRLEGIKTSPMGLYLFDPGPTAWHWAGGASAR